MNVSLKLIIAYGTIIAMDLLLLLSKGIPVAVASTRSLLRSNSKYLNVKRSLPVNIVDEYLVDNEIAGLSVEA